MEKTTGKEFTWTPNVTVICGGSTQSKGIPFSTDVNRVHAEELKSGFLRRFDATASLVDDGEGPDRNESYHLVGIDKTGARTTFRDDEDVDLTQFAEFELLPRTVGGVK